MSQDDLSVKLVAPTIPPKVRRRGTGIGGGLGNSHTDLQNEVDDIQHRTVCQYKERTTKVWHRKVYSKAASKAIGYSEKTVHMCAKLRLCIVVTIGLIANAVQYRYGEQQITMLLTLFII